MNTMNAKFCKALAGFSQEVPAIHQNTKGYGYTYSNLTDILRVINPLLKKHGLGFTQIVDGTSLKTVVFHVESGDTIEGTVDIPQGVTLKGMNDFQVMGSAISYLRRYSLAATLCLVTDADLDASGEQSNGAKPTITEARFKKALEAIEKDEYTQSELEIKYALTNAQIKELKAIKS